jgi:hypothetical protein
MYEGCQKPCTWTKDIANSVLLHAKVYQLADKFQVDSLKLLAMHKFAVACAFGWKEDNFVEATRHVCETTRDGDAAMREIVVETIIHHLGMLKNPLVEEFLGEYGDVALDVLNLRAAEEGCISE